MAASEPMLHVRPFPDQAHGTTMSASLYPTLVPTKGSLQFYEGVKLASRPAVSRFRLPEE